LRHSSAFVRQFGPLAEIYRENAVTRWLSLVSDLQELAVICANRSADHRPSTGEAAQAVRRRPGRTRANPHPALPDPPDIIEGGGRAHSQARETTQGRVAPPRSRRPGAMLRSNVGISHNHVHILRTNVGKITVPGNHPLVPSVHTDPRITPLAALNRGQ